MCAGWLSLHAQIPSPKDFLGYEIGERFTPHHKLVSYFQALAASAPGQMKLEQYGTTYEGRPLLLAYFGSTENLGNLENIRLNNLKLAGIEPGGGNANAPAIVWLSYNVHGNEASSSEAVMLTVHYLLTNPQAKEWFKNTVVIIDPCINPDGRDRYVNWYNSVAGANMNVDPASREHSEPWPGGRTNHYTFDLNRDWAWQSQVETQHRLKKYNAWLPQVHVDYHEQGFNEPYYFAPAAEPYHEVITPWQRQFQVLIGKNHAKYFDQNGWLYFTKERFDLFYPSYGDTYPTYNGAIGMTYEQGGIRAGLGIINEDDDTLTLKDRATHHHTTGLSTIEVSSQQANQLVDNFKKFFAEAVSNGSGEYKSYVLKAKGQQGRMKSLLELLDRNGIVYGYANGGTVNGYNYLSGKSESFNLEQGDVVVNTLQPKGALARVLFEPQSKITDSATYDITAWSLPYAFGLPAYGVKEKLNATKGLAVPAGPAMVGGAYGYLKTWNSFEDAKFLANCHKRGIKVRVSEKPLEMDGKQYPAGTLIIIRTSNFSVANFDDAVLKLAAEHKTQLVPVKSGFVDKGSDFGSSDVRSLRKPRVAMLTGDQTAGLSAGVVWHYLDQQLKYPVSLINVSDAGRTDWKKYDVVMAPDGSYQQLFARDGALRNWVSQGGRLVALENAVAMVANAEWGGLKVKKPEEEKKGDYADLRTYASREKDYLKESNPGSIFRLDLDNTHPLGFGFPNYYYTLKSDLNMYEFMKEGWNVGVVKKEGKVAGFTGVNATKKLKDGVLIGQLPVGRGSVVFFTDDPIFRSFWESGKLLLANAIFM